MWPLLYSPVATARRAPCPIRRDRWGKFARAVGIPSSIRSPPWRWSGTNSRFCVTRDACGLPIQYRFNTAPPRRESYSLSLPPSPKLSQLLQFKQKQTQWLVAGCIQVNRESSSATHRYALFHQRYSSRTEARCSSMATAPAKSQPLHNFSLPSFLRWGGGSSNHHQRFRRSAPPGDSPVVEADSDRTDSDHDSRSPWVGSRHSHRFLFNAACSENLGKPHGHLKELKVENQGIGGRDEIMNTKNGEKGSGEADETEHMPLSREAVQRSWNLRPRRSNPSSKDAEYSSVFIAAAQSPGDNHVSKPLRLRGHADSSAAAGGEGKEKRRLRIALSKEEIEEDIFSMTGSRPARRPKKRPKHVQKVLNTIFPGLWLVGASAADYRMADAQTKK